MFTKIGKEIAMAVKAGGSDPSANSKLRDLIAKAKSNNMPNDTIERGIKKAAGDVGNVNYEYIAKICNISVTDYKKAGISSLSRAQEIEISALVECLKKIT